MDVAKPTQLAQRLGDEGVHVLINRLFIDIAGSENRFTLERGGMDKEKLRACIEQVYRDAAGATTSGLAYLGVRTGLFELMARKGSITSNVSLPLSLVDDGPLPGG